MTAYILTHLFAAIAALMLGVVNLVRPKGTLYHKVVGWAWIVAMLTVTVSSFWIHDVNSSFSWLHGLSVFTILSMALALFAIRRGWVRTHANAMTGTVVGSLIAGALAFLPGRFLSELLGYSPL